MICKHCGENIHLNGGNNVWYHWDSYRTCLENLSPNTTAEPKENHGN